MTILYGMLAIKLIHIKFLQTENILLKQLDQKRGCHHFQKEKKVNMMHLEWAIPVLP